MPKKFGRIVLASTGDFPGETDNKVKGWVEHAGGTFVKELSKDVTHLVCSEKAWKRYYPIGMFAFPRLLCSITSQARADRWQIVREARRMHTVHIVKLNWLEDSLLSKSGKPLDPAQYEWEQRKVKPGATKRKRNQEESMDETNEAKKPKPAKRTRTREASDVAGGGRSKNERIEKAGKFSQARRETNVWRQD
jgi:anthranilate synthase/indole-3-glycerol phosphate synthase/phosphoribosylanthranilate isomerase